MQSLMFDPWIPSGYYYYEQPYLNRPHRAHIYPAKGLGDTAEVILSEEKFQVKLDSRQFSPNEISVMTTDGQLVIEGEHGDRLEACKCQGTYTSRSFCRKFQLPENCQVAKLISEIGTDGILRVTIPRHHVKGGGVMLHQIKKHAHYGYGHGHVAHPTAKGIGCVGKHPPWHGWPWSWSLTSEDRYDPSITGLNETEDNYVYRLELPEFSPDEVVVKTVNDEFLVVEGNHPDKLVFNDPSSKDKEESGFGFVSRKFKRQYVLPHRAQWEELVCEIDKNGVLSITIPKEKKKPQKETEEEEEKEIVHPITPTAGESIHGLGHHHL